MKVELFIPCYIDQLHPSTAISMIKVLEKLGCEVFYNTEQTCCGHPAFNSGFWDEAKEVGEKFIREFSTDRYVVCPSSSCVGMVRNSYNYLFHNSSLHNQCRQLQKNLYEFTEFIVDVLKVHDIGAVLDAHVTYHDACTALRECNVKQHPRTLLENVKGLRLTEMNDTETCCGFGGLFAVNFEPISVGMANEKIKNAGATHAEYIVSTDYSCLMHLQGYIKTHGQNLRVLHIADLLAAGI
jgi:L-lactate dehydrogenase complex protein LldE